MIQPKAKCLCVCVHKYLLRRCVCGLYALNEKNLHFVNAGVEVRVQNEYIHIQNAIPQIEFRSHSDFFRINARNLDGFTSISTRRMFHIT